MDKKISRLKIGCYMGNISMAVVANLSALLFITFRELYDISYTLLGLLVLINFCTQLLIDLAFSFFSKKFNVPKIVRITPILTVLGLFIYALSPVIFPTAPYAGLVVGTVIFSAAAGFSEVLISPVFASIPAENPDREMSKLHSTYAWGVVLVAIFSTLFLNFVGRDNWMWLSVSLAVLPAIGAFFFFTTDVPALKGDNGGEGEAAGQRGSALSVLKSPAMWLCFFSIFFGGAAEQIMTQWCSGFAERSLGLNKMLGDIVGLALFAVMLGLGRTLYARLGKNIEVILLAGGIGATLCYLAAALSGIPIIGLLSCALTGLCTSMLWPGSLVVSSKRLPTGGVMVYALMAAGGDLGASVGPQLIGAVTDTVAASGWGAELANTLSMTAEQLAMRVSMGVAALFPILGVVVYTIIVKTKKKYENQQNTQ